MAEDWEHEGYIVVELDPHSVEELMDAAEKHGLEYARRLRVLRERIEEEHVDLEEPEAD